MPQYVSGSWFVCVCVCLCGFGDQTKFLRCARQVLTTEFLPSPMSGTWDEAMDEVLYGTITKRSKNIVV
jgi:hypothetical protein